MHALLLVFLATAWLDELALAWLLGHADSRGARLAPALATGAIVLLATAAWLGGVPTGWPLDGTKLSRYLAAFAFFAVLLQLSAPRAAPALVSSRLRAWRRYLPLVVATAAVAASAALGPSWVPDPRVAIATTIGLPLAMVLLMPVGAAFLHRLHLAAAPVALRGAPLVLLSAAIAAMAMQAASSVLPW